MAHAIVNVKYPEQRLFQAIIVQAFEDCCFKTYSKVDAYNKEDSYNWFKNKSEDFERVCWFADMDPDFVRERFLKLRNDKVITFSATELMWMEYREKYRRYRAVKDKESRRIIKRQIDRLTLPGAIRKKPSRE